MINLLKPNLLNILITIILMAIVYVIGVMYFNNPVWIKTGCAPNPACPTCEICMSWGFPGIINFQMLPLLILLYLISSLVSLIFKKK